VTLSKVVENSIPVSLIHSGVDVVACIAQICYLLCKKFHSLCRVAKDDGLVDVQLREERVEAMDLLLLLDEGVVLSNSLQGQLIHQIDLVRVDSVLFLKNRETNRKKLEKISNN
jgi:hypothetical protein